MREVMVLYDIAENPVPEGAIVGSLSTPSGDHLRTAHWRATGRRPRGTVCLFGGRTEFIEKYFEVISELRERGFAVATMDWHGQGGSDRPLSDALLGHCRKPDRFVSDVRHFMREVALPDCPPPYYALAHSMGAAILLNTLTRQPGYFERAVLSAPMLRIGTGHPSPAALRRIANTMCRIGLGSVAVNFSRGTIQHQRFANNRLTSDPRRFARTEAILTAAPQLGLGQPTFGWLRAACALIDAIDDVDFPARMRVPVLIVAAGADRIVSSRAAERLARRLKNGGLVMIPGAQHEILMERDILREAFWGAFDAFVPGSPVFAEA